MLRLSKNSKLLKRLCLCAFVVTAIDPFNVFAQEAVVSQDSLAWLAKRYSCEEFAENFHARYMFLGSLAALPEKKREEALKAREVACSPTYKKCNFEICSAKLPSVSMPAVVDNNPESFDQPDSEAGPAKSMDIEELAKFVSRFRLLQRDEIAKRVAEEQAQGIEWARFVVLDEMKARVKKEAPEVKPSQTPDRRDDDYENEYRPEYKSSSFIGF